jgi:hypothetical protein
LYQSGCRCVDIIYIYIYIYIQKEKLDCLGVDCLLEVDYHAPYHICCPMSDSEQSNGGEASERACKAPSTLLQKQKCVVRTCALCEVAGTDVDSRFYGEWLHLRCVAGVRSKTRLMTPALKSADKRKFMNDRKNWQDRFGILGIIAIYSVICMFVLGCYTL